MADSIIDSFNKTNLDTENKEPSGGPINAPDYNFETKYSAQNPYFNQGTQFQESKLSSSLTVTGLDVESSEAGPVEGGSGGPNRTNSTNIPSGQYKAIGSSPLPMSETAGGEALTNRKGEAVTFTLNYYTPENTYMAAMKSFRDGDDIVNGSSEGGGTSTPTGLPNPNPGGRPGQL